MPNRVLRDWTNSERFDNLSVEAEIFFTRLIMKADDFGGFYGNPKLLKAHLFPLKDFQPIKIKKWILECVEIDVIIYYEVDDKMYIRINDFGQRTRIMKSKFPDPVIVPQSNDGQTTVKRPLETKPNQTETETETPPTPKGEIIDFNRLLIFFNKTFDKESILVNNKAKKSYKSRIKEGFTIDNIEKAMLNASKDDFHINNNYKHATLEFFSRADKIDKFINFKGNGQTGQNISRDKARSITGQRQNYD